MAVPFRRTSKTKKRMRRTHLKKEVGALTTCSKCGATIRPHRACKKCGNYKGKEAIAVAEKTEKEDKNKNEKK
jgi:large subunit ribosomal protein L32